MHSAFSATYILWNDGKAEKVIQTQISWNARHLFYSRCRRIIYQKKNKVPAKVAKKKKIRIFFSSPCEFMEEPQHECAGKTYTSDFPAKIYWMLPWRETSRRKKRFFRGGTLHRIRLTFRTGSIRRMLSSPQQRSYQIRNGRSPTPPEMARPGDEGPIRPWSLIKTSPKPQDPSFDGRFAAFANLLLCEGPNARFKCLMNSKTLEILQFFYRVMWSHLPETKK